MTELWRYRDVFSVLVRRDLSIRYTQTVLGVTWAFLPSVLSAALFTLVFGRVAHMPSDGAPYLLFVYSALVPWQFFSAGVLQAASSLVAHQQLLTKVYFPRILIPLASIAFASFDAAINCLVLVLLLIHYGVRPAPVIWSLPVYALLAVCIAVVAGVGLAALNVRYRDVRHALPFVMQLWMFATPVLYPISMLPVPWRGLFLLNPLAPVVEGIRSVLLETQAPGVTQVLTTVVLVGLIGIVSFRYFRRVETSFADIV